MISWWSLPAVMSAAFLLYLFCVRPGRQYAQEYGRAVWWLSAISGTAVALLGWAVAFLLKVLA